MEKFIRHTGVGAPLRRSAVDTDQIIPAVYLKRITRTGFEDALFASGGPASPSSCSTRRPTSVPRAGGGPDFGTGSSREHAVWALKDYGFRSYWPRDSRTSSGATRASRGWWPGLSAGGLPSSCGSCWRPSRAEVTVDLESRTVEAGVFRTSFAIDDYVRWS